MGVVATELHARMSAVADKFEAEAPVGAEEGAVEAPEVEAGVEAAPVETVVSDDAPVETETTEAAPTPEDVERAKKHELLEEKLRYHRERRAAIRAGERAAAVERERQAVEAERKKYEGLKQGTFKKTLEELGIDPAKAYEEMTREAVEASTPEGKVAREIEAVKRQIAETVEPLKQQVQALVAERQRLEQQLADQQYTASVATSLKQTVEAPEFEELRVRYRDEVLLDHAKYYDKHPKELIEHARTFGVRLTDPTKGFTMHELLSVLAAAQAADDAEVASRRQARSPAGAQKPANPTVNGTTATARNAGNAVGNELAAGRAASRPDESSLPVAERIRRRVEAEIRRQEGR